jgi:putative flippase GtrA
MEINSIGMPARLARKRDMVVAAIMGLFFGALAIPILINFEIKQAWLLILMAPISAGVFAMTLFVTYLATSSISSLYQFAKFSLVGALNSTVDFGALNSLILATGIVSGVRFIGIKSASATLAVINSYFWNKYWTFEGVTSGGSMMEFVAFLVVSLVGIGFNIVGAHIVVNVIGPPSQFPPKLWANIGALSAAVLTMFSNFLGYKFFVFRTPEQNH